MHVIRREPGIRWAEVAQAPGDGGLPAGSLGLVSLGMCRRWHGTVWHCHFVPRCVASAARGKQHQVPTARVCSPGFKWLRLPCTDVSQGTGISHMEWGCVTAVLPQGISIIITLIASRFVYFNLVKLKTISVLSTCILIPLKHTRP